MSVPENEFKNNNNVTATGAIYTPVELGISRYLAIAVYIIVFLNIVFF